MVINKLQSREIRISLRFEGVSHTVGNLYFSFVA